MSQKNNGGPAFPRPLSEQGGNTSSAQKGMTLRDYFAAHAPVAPRDWYEQDGHAQDENIIQLAIKWRWHYADAMLAAREVQS